MASIINHKEDARNYGHGAYNPITHRVNNTGGNVSMKWSKTMVLFFVFCLACKDEQVDQADELGPRGMAVAAGGYMVTAWATGDTISASLQQGIHGTPPLTPITMSFSAIRIFRAVGGTHHLCTKTATIRA